MFRASLLTAMTLTASGWIGCALSGPVTVAFQYTLPPERGVPEGVTRIAAVPTSSDPKSDARWANIAIDRIRRKFESVRQSGGPALRLVDPAKTRAMFEESNLTVSDIRSGLGAPEARQIGAQAFLIADVSVKTVRGRGGQRDTVIRQGSGPQGQPTTRQDETIRQTISCQGKIEWVDVQSGAIWTAHQDRLQLTEQTEPPSWLGTGGKSKLSSEDQVADRFVHDLVAQFCGKLFGRRVSKSIPVRSSMNASCAQGVEYLRERNYTQALAEFEKALNSDPTDHRAMFAAGVTSEALNRRSQALDFYQQACLLESRPNYVDARDRLSREIIRGRRPTYP